MHVALYARVSTTRQAENDLSIPDQLRQLNEWAIANGHLAVQEYVEPGVSATDDKRPVFQRMFADAMMKPPSAMRHWQERCRRCRKQKWATCLNKCPLLT